MAKRGRPVEEPIEKKDKWELNCKSYNGDEITYVYDKNKNPNGVSTISKHLGKPIKHKIKKNESYSPQPVVMVFKTTRKNAKPKMKVWNNTNIDHINSVKKLPGVPDNAEILELAVGNKYKNEFKNKYQIK